MANILLLKLCVGFDSMLWHRCIKYICFTASLLSNYIRREILCFFIYHKSLNLLKKKILFHFQSHVFTFESALSVEKDIQKQCKYSLAHDAIFCVGKISGLVSKIDGTAGAE